MATWMGATHQRLAARASSSKTEPEDARAIFSGQSHAFAKTLERCIDADLLRDKDLWATKR